MASPIVKGGTDTITNADLNAFLALPTKEQQAAFLFAKGQNQNIEFNAANPANPIQRILTNVSFTSQQFQGIIVAPLVANAVTLGLVAGTSSETYATPLAIEAGDTVTNTELNAFLALGSYEKQMIQLLVDLSAAENAENIANPDGATNRVSILPNFDANVVEAQMLLSMSNLAVLQIPSEVEPFLP